MHCPDALGWGLGGKGMVGEDGVYLYYFVSFTSRKQIEP